MERPLNSYKYRCPVMFRAVHHTSFKNNVWMLRLKVQWCFMYITVWWRLRERFSCRGAYCMQWSLGFGPFFLILSWFWYGHLDIYRDKKIICNKDTNLMVWHTPSYYTIFKLIKVFASFTLQFLPHRAGHKGIYQKPFLSTVQVLHLLYQ